jgi:hypothetical protein
MCRVKMMVRVVLIVLVLLLLLAFPLQALAWSPPPPPPSPPPPSPSDGGGAGMIGGKARGGGGGWGARVPSEPVGGFGSWGMPALVGPAATVQGYIVDLVTGRRAEQVKIKINDAVVTSDWDGFYSLTGVPEGDYQVELLLEPGQGVPAQGPVTIHVGRNGAALSLGYYSGEQPAGAYVPPARPVPPPPPPALVMPAVPHPVPAYPQGQSPPAPPGVFDQPLWNFDAPPGAPQWGQNPYYYTPLGLANSGDPGNPGNPGDPGNPGNPGDPGNPGNPAGALANIPDRLPVTALIDTFALLSLVAVSLGTLGSIRRLLVSQS